MRRAIPLLLVSFTGASAQPTEMQRAADAFKTLTRELGLRPDSPPQTRQTAPRPVYHGRIFDFVRNDVFDAVPHEIVQRGGSKSLLRRNQFGLNVSGPLWIPGLYNGGRNTFITLSYEGVRERISRTNLRTVPTLLERTGDWSQVVDQAGAQLPVYDPASTSRNPNFDHSQPVSTDNLEYARSPFPGNVIPASRLDPRAVELLREYPAPNTDVGPFFQNNYFINAPETSEANGFIAKADHTVSARQRLTLDTAWSNGKLGSAQWFPSAANPGPPDRNFSSRRASAEHIFTVAPQTVNIATFGASSNTSRDVGGDFPFVQLGPYLAMGRAYPFSRNAQNNFAWTDALSTRVGEHSLRFVAQFSKNQVNAFSPRYPAGSYRFGSGLTSLPGIVNTGHAMASYLLGLSEFAELSRVEQPSYFRRHGIHLVARDQWEIRKGLSVSAGLTLDRYSPRSEKYDRQSTVDLVTGRLAAGRTFQQAFWRPSPNASLAWTPEGKVRSVVRLNYARSYGAIPVHVNQWGTQGYNSYETVISQNTQLQPAAIFENGFPAVGRPLPDLRPEAADNTVADLIDTSDRHPVYQSASFSYERDLPGSAILTAGLTYSGGRNLLIGNNVANPNAISLDALVYRDDLNNEAFRRTLRPYPQYQSFDVGGLWPIGRYQRDAAYLRYEKRASQGLTFNAVYEYSKQLDDYSGPYGRQDFFNRDNEWSLTAGNEPHRLTFSYTYELPFGPNKSLLPYSDWRRHLVDGWSIAGTGSVESGDALYLHPQFNNTGGVVRTLNVNVVPGVDPSVPNQSPSLWFNPAAFAQPDDFTIGNASRTHPYLRNPGGQNYDLTVNKRVALGPDRTLELNAAGFNFINHANWNNPDTVIGPESAPNVNAGRIIGSRGGRVIQVGLRLSF